MPSIEKRRNKHTGRMEPSGTIWADVAACDFHEAKGGATPRFRRKFTQWQDAMDYEAHCRRTGEEPDWCLTPMERAGIKKRSGKSLYAVWEAAERDGGPKRSQGCWKDGRDKGGWRRRRDVAKLFADVDVRLIGRDHVRKLVEYLENRPGRKRTNKLSKRTINRYRSALSSILQWAVEEGLIDGKPVFAYTREEETLIEWITVVQEATLLRLMRERGWVVEATCTAFLLAVGLRWSEFARLRPQDISDPVALTETGKVGCVVSIHKTKINVPRQLPIAPQLANEMRAVLRQNLSPRYHTFVERLKTIGKECGAHDNLTAHILRHTTATRLACHPIYGKNHAAIQYLMGHKNIQQTMRYIHMNLASIAEIVLPHGGGEGILAYGYAK